MKCDFSGWATVNDVLCSDGRTIKKGAFSENNGKQVPLVWQHQHSDPDNVLGHCILEERETEDKSGIYAYCFFNNTEKAQVAKELVHSKDINQLSIYANKLSHTRKKEVIHGDIIEVSLVLAGANCEAFIDTVSMEHSEEGSEEDAYIYTGEDIIMDNEEVMEHTDSESESSSETVADVFNTLNEKQKKAVCFIMGQLLDGTDEEEMEQSDEEGEDFMKHNVFEGEEPKGQTLSHADFTAMIEEAKNNKALLSDIFKAHEVEVVAHSIDGQDDQITETYGIHNLEYLFPEARTMERYPQWIKNEDEWVSGWLSGTKKNPFSRIKMVYADITMEEARARGYIKGHEKKEEVFKLLKRTISPTTIYKKQKFDRDDLIDITDLDVVSWVKGEMRMMLNQEIAVAELLGDGRDPDSEDKIDETKIIPVVKDDPFYTMTFKIGENDLFDSETGKVNATDFVDHVVEKMIEYKGTGSPNLYTTRAFLNQLLLARDMLGHRLWKTKGELATEMGVKNIIEVEQIDGKEDDAGNSMLYIIVNPQDYVTGADKGGAINTFDDFDIDFNQYKYLMETRISGGLTKPKSAIVGYMVAADDNG